MTLLRIKHLPPDIMEKACANMLHFKCRVDINYPLFCAFNFKQAREGEEYWKDVVKTYLKNLK